MADLDSCDEVQKACDAFVTCCGGCGNSTAEILDQCTPGNGGICGISSCGAPEVAAAGSPEKASSMCFEAMKNNAKCLMKECPNYDFQCGTSDSNNCEELQGTCNKFVECCGGCDETTTGFVNACMGDVCEGIIGCDGGSLAVAQEDGAKPAGLDVCFEAMAETAMCLASTCPNFDKDCGTAVDSNDCAALQTNCVSLAECCDGCDAQISKFISACTPCDGIQSCDPDSMVDPDTMSSSTTCEMSAAATAVTGLFLAFAA